MTVIIVKTIDAVLDHHLASLDTLIREFAFCLSFTLVYHRNRVFGEISLRTHTDIIIIK